MKNKLRYLAPECEAVAFVTQGIIAVSVKTSMTINNPFGNVPEIEPEW